MPAKKKIKVWILNEQFFSPPYGYFYKLFTKKIELDKHFAEGFTRDQINICVKYAHRAGCPKIRPYEVKEVIIRMEEVK